MTYIVSSGALNSTRSLQNSFETFVSAKTQRSSCFSQSISVSAVCATNQRRAAGGERCCVRDDAV